MPPACILNVTRHGGWNLERELKRPRSRQPGMHHRRFVVIAVLLVGLGACAGPGASGDTLTEAEAVQRVLAQDSRFTGIGPVDPDLIGQAAWYEVAGTADGWQVRIRIGWGDCPAGCIHQHQWTYAVTRSGAVSLLNEEGDPAPAATGIRGVAVAGPTCPVVTDPPDPECVDRPVEGAVIVVLDGSGAEVGRATTAADGTFAIGLAPGAYRVVPQAVEGLMGTAEPHDVGLVAGEPMAELTIAYDTGIR